MVFSVVGDAVGASTEGLFVGAVVVGVLVADLGNRVGISLLGVLEGALVTGLPLVGLTVVGTLEGAWVTGLLVGRVVVGDTVGL